MSAEKIQSYYFSFRPTGDKAIDKILLAVAAAGRYSHCTSGWADDCSEFMSDMFRGDTYEQVIQNAADDAVLARCGKVGGRKVGGAKVGG